MNSHYKLTIEVQSEICAFIRAGGFPHVAAEAAGIPKDVFESWLARGRKRGKRNAYHDFADAIRQAVAQARLAAEIKAFQDDPVTWLKQGPGKETADSPGWTTTVKPIIREGNQTINVLLSPEMQGVFAAILQVLAPYPEARAAVAQALAGEKTARLEVK
jgi:hypothetical protein